MLRLGTFYTAIFLAVFVCLLAGCGSDNVPLRGKVTFSDNGEPVPVGTVAFLKEGRIARGTIRTDGTYIVGFERQTDGMPPGKYEVFISGAQKLIGTSADGDPIFELLIGEKYTAASTSGLTLEVNASTKVFNIEVERYVPTPGRR